MAANDEAKNPQLPAFLSNMNSATGSLPRGRILVELENFCEMKYSFNTDTCLALPSALLAICLPSEMTRAEIPD